MNKESQTKFQDIVKNFYQNLVKLTGNIIANDKNNEPFDFYQALEKVGQLVAQQTSKGKKVIFIGNGASAAIASHMATDYWKNGGMRAVSFNDSSLLTCVSNDFGYLHVFEKPINMFADEGDILFAISSSGKSENILRGVQAAKDKGCYVISLSGFKTDNPLRFLGKYNFYVPDKSYSSVEVLHLSICHCILDAIIAIKKP